MAFQMTLINPARDGSATYNIEFDEQDYILCAPEKAVGRFMEEAGLTGLDVDIISSEIPRIAERRIELDFYLRGRAFRPTSLVLTISTPRSSDSAAKWAFAGRKRARVLIVCSGNSCRSQIAEGYLRKTADHLIEVYSAGLCPEVQVNPNAIETMSELEIDISQNRPKSIQAFTAEEFDYVVSVCDVRASTMPFRSSSTVTLDYGVVDPVAFQDLLPQQELVAQFRQTRDTIIEVLDELVTEISGSMCFLGSRSERQRAAQRVFEPTLTKQRIVLEQLRKVVVNPVRELEVFEVRAADLELALNKHIPEFKKHFPMHISGGIALGLTLLTSSVTVSFWWLADLHQESASASLTMALWFVAIGLIVLGVKSWWSERRAKCKEATIRTIIDCLIGNSKTQGGDTVAIQTAKKRQRNGRYAA